MVSCSCFRKAEVLHLACLNKVLDRSCHIFDGHLRVNPVLVKQIDGVHPQPLERGLGDALDLLWPAVQAHRRARPLFTIMFEPKLGGNHHLPAKRLQRFAHQFLVGKRPVHFGRVEECDPALNRRAQKRDHFLPVGDGVFIVTHSHAAEPERRNFQAAVSKFSFLHFQNSCHTVNLGVSVCLTFIKTL